MRRPTSSIVVPTIALLISSALNFPGASADPWSDRQIFQAVLPEANCGFSAALSIDGDVMAIGQPRGTAMGVSCGGSVEIWRRNGTWSREATIFPAAPLVDAHFGAAVSIHGDSVVIGEPDRSSPSHSKAGLIQTNQRNASTGLWDSSETVYGLETGENLGTAITQMGNLIGPVDRKPRSRAYAVGESATVRPAVVPPGAGGNGIVKATDV